MTPLLTVVIPVYNRAGIVCKTLDSLARQTLRPLDVVLVDNNSADGSLEVLRQWAAEVADETFRVKVISETRPGACAARNAGLAAVETEWTMFFDSDDTMAPGHCRRVADAIAANPHADIIGWPVMNHTLAGDTKVLGFDARNAAFHNLFHGSLSTQRYVARTALVRDCGGWPHNVTAWDDIELGMRLLQKTKAVVDIGPEITVDVWSREVSLSGTDFHSGAERFETSLDCMQGYATASLRRAINLKRMILAGDCAHEGDTPTARRLCRRALEDEPSVFYRALLRAAYAYVKRGGRGIARIFMPFYCRIKL